MGAKEQFGAQLASSYDFNENLEAFVHLTWAESSSATAHELPTTAGGGLGVANSRVFANHALNPINQDLQVSPVHIKAPDRPQFVGTASTRPTTGLRGVSHENWQ